MGTAPWWKKNLFAEAAITLGGIALILCIPAIAYEMTYAQFALMLIVSLNVALIVMLEPIARGTLPISVLGIINFLGFSVLAIAYGAVSKIPTPPALAILIGVVCAVLSMVPNERLGITKLGLVLVVAVLISIGVVR